MKPSQTSALLSQNTVRKSTSFTEGLLNLLFCYSRHNHRYCVTGCGVGFLTTLVVGVGIFLSGSASPIGSFLHHTPKLGISVEMVQVLMKLLLKQISLAVYHDFHGVLVVAKFLTAKLHSPFVKQSEILERSDISPPTRQPCNVNTHSLAVLVAIKQNIFPTGTLRPGNSNLWSSHNYTSYVKPEACIRLSELFIILYVQYNDNVTFFIISNSTFTMQ